MTEQQCTRCAALEVEIARLRKENDLLRRKLQRIREFVERVKERTERILSQRSGVWRDKWHVAEGADKTADGVLRRC